MPCDTTIRDKLQIKYGDNIIISIKPQSKTLIFLVKHKQDNILNESWYKQNSGVKMSRQSISNGKSIFRYYSYQN